MSSTRQGRGRDEPAVERERRRDGGREGRDDRGDHSERDRTERISRTDLVERAPRGDRGDRSGRDRGEHRDPIERGEREHRRTERERLRNHSRSRSLGPISRGRSRSLQCGRSPSFQRARSRSVHRGRSRSFQRCRSRSVQRGRRRRASRSRSWSEYQRRREASLERRRAAERLAREQEREEREKERAEKEPSETILVHDIPDTGITEDQVESAAWSLAVQAGSSMPNGVRFAYDRSTEKFRGFAILEFPHKEAAKIFKEHTAGRLEIDGLKLTLKYHHPRAELSCSPERGDRRGQDDKSVTLIVKGLSCTTSEASVCEAFQPFASVKDIRLFAKRAFAFVQFHSVDDAAVALHKFEHECRSRIDGQRVLASFAKEREDTRFLGPERGFLAKQAMASAEANQFEEKIAQAEQQQVQQLNAEKALTGVNSEMWASYMQSFSQTETVQSSDTFKYDKDTGFYKDEKAGLYYDPNTTYFFTTDYKKYFVYDHQVEMLCHVDSQGQKVPGGERRPLPGKEAKSTRERGSGGRSRSPKRNHRSRSRRAQRSPSRRGRERFSGVQRPSRNMPPTADQVEKNNGDFKPIHFPGGDPLAKLASPAPAPAAPKPEPKKKKRPPGEDVLGLAPMPDKSELLRPGRVTVLGPGAPKPGPVHVFEGHHTPISAMPTIPGHHTPFSAVPAMPAGHHTPLSAVATMPSLGLLNGVFGAASVTPGVLGAMTAPPTVAASVQMPSAFEPSGVMPGEWICEVCMRKFSSEEMLLKHELMSDLHKQNLAKLNGDV